MPLPENDPEFEQLLDEAATAIMELLTQGIPEDGPAPSVPTQLFLRCDCCDRPIRSETLFVCRDCRRRYAATEEPMHGILMRGMDQLDAMRDTWSAAHCARSFN